MKKLTLGIVFCLLCGASAAFADTIFKLNCTSPTNCDPNVTWGLVTVVQDGLNQVDVTVDLTDGKAWFVNTGNGNSNGNGHGNSNGNGNSTNNFSFVFNLNSNVLPATVGFLDPYSSANFTYRGGVGYFQPGFGSFGFAFDCRENVNGVTTDPCGPGSSQMTDGPLSFYVQGTDITPASFIANLQGVFFSADLYFEQTAGVFGTGMVGSMRGTTSSNPPVVPEPTSLVLLGSGILGLAGVTRLRNRNSGK
jgi:hypothetical protein